MHIELIAVRRDATPISAWAKDDEGMLKTKPPSPTRRPSIAVPELINMVIVEGADVASDVETKLVTVDPLAEITLLVKAVLVYRGGVGTSMFILATCHGNVRLIE
jgi:hypothetical protein